MDSLVNILGAATIGLCALLLLRAFVRVRERLLLWSGLCFAGLTLANTLVFVDLSLVPGISLYTWRLGIAAVSSSRATGNDQRFPAGRHRDVLARGGGVFFKFWRQTRAPLFLAFTVAFVIEGLNRIGFLLLPAPSLGSDLIYGVRLLSYLLIFAAIIHRNRA